MNITRALPIIRQVTPLAWSTALVAMLILLGTLLLGALAGGAGQALPVGIGGAAATLVLGVLVALAERRTRHRGERTVRAIEAWGVRVRPPERPRAPVATRRSPYASAARRAA